ncbi:MAG: leucine-rich repeat protein [Ruminiclostridium sp.]
MPVTGIIFDAFANNASIKTVIIPESVDFISTNVFSGCTNLEKVIILCNNVTFFENSFSGCNATISYNGKDYTPDNYSELTAN